MPNDKFSFTFNVSSYAEFKQLVEKMNEQYLKQKGAINWLYTEYTEALKTARDMPIINPIPNIYWNYGGFKPYANSIELTILREPEVIITEYHWFIEYFKKWGILTKWVEFKGVSDDQLANSFKVAIWYNVTGTYGHIEFDADNEDLTFEQNRQNALKAAIVYLCKFLPF